ncbi:uncharacterized protein FA14DRAFT_152074 [Meira miltonrushii]|uniref:Protein N-terminal glutamine amidohydrolase n=1 Tax=Meira miltonrushii TaxID=1280837 RepID=A0A316VHB9_9BASI|nr:uncharacterized protein FA14DRAFT_152074 [Meira miltonrushii]PWN36644.1 hypothetical protein FA14DRAFT_152074 [Meira miltonrushii]
MQSRTSMSAEEADDDSQSIFTDTATLVGTTEYANVATSSRQSDPYDNASITGRSSTSTLRPLPRQHSAPPPTDYSTNRRWQDDTVSINTITDDRGLVVPWWSAVLPDPSSLMRSRSQRRGNGQQSRPSRTGASTSDAANSPPTVLLPRFRRTAQLGTSGGGTNGGSSSSTTQPRSALDTFNSSSPTSSNDSSYIRLRNIPRSVSTPTSMSFPDRQQQILQRATSMFMTSESASEAVEDDCIPEFVPEPPALPQPYDIYTKCYCEENAYILAAYLDRICKKRNKEENHDWQWNVDVVFVSNENKNVALWQQRASQMPETDNIVIWDYHVFVVVSCTPKPRSQSHASLGRRPSARTTHSSGPMSARLPRRQSTVPTDYSILDTVYVPQSNPGLTETETKTTYSWVYDLDSCLRTPTRLSQYLQATFKSDIHTTVSAHFRPRFRIIPAASYFAYFASDRSHMLITPSQEERETFEAICASTGWVLDSQLPQQYNSPLPRWPNIRGALAESDNLLMDSYVNMIGGAGDDRYGTTVSLLELMQGTGLCNDGYVPVQDAPTSRNGSERARREEGDHIQSSVKKMLDDLQNGSQLTRQMSVQSHSRSNSTSSSNEGSQSEDLPGFVLGVRRFYGRRPPPPVPEGVDRFARVDFTGRGKRVTNPLFPAYMHATLQSRAAFRQSQNQNQRSGLPPPPPPPTSTSQ